MWGALAAGAGLGVAKHYLADKPAAERNRATQAEVARYSPWTGMKPTPVEDPSLFNSALQGGTMGASLGQGMDAADAQEAMQAQQGGLVDAQTNYYNSMAGPKYATPVAAGSAGSMGGKSPWNNMSPMAPMGPSQY